MIKELRSPIKIHGGKYYIRKFVVSKFPDNYESMNYVEAFCGGCNVLLYKNKSITETINDLDKGVYDIFYYLKNKPDEFLSLLNDIEYNEETFDLAKKEYSPINELIRRRMSRGGLKESFCWSERKRGGQPGEVNSWMTLKNNHLPLVCERMKDVEIFNENAIDLIKKKDTSNTLFYLDPPYLQSTRTCNKCYDVEMKESDHRILAEVLQNVKGKVILSGYFSPLYAKLYKNWTMNTKEVANHSSQSKTKQRRIEVLWRNYD